MKEDKLKELSTDFTVEIVNLCKEIKGVSPLVNQLLRSATSIGANIREAKYAQGKADFISKLQISLKEANETGYWLELLFRTQYISNEQYNKYNSLCSKIRVMLISSINTSKTNI